MMSTIFRVTLSDIPEDTEAVCPENEKITNIQTTAGRYQKYLRIILNIKLLYLSPPLILSIINSVTKASRMHSCGGSAIRFLQQFLRRILHKGAHTHVQKKAAVHGCHPWHCNSCIYAHTRTSVNNRGQQELIPAVFSFSITIIYQGLPAPHFL